MHYPLNPAQEIDKLVLLYPKLDRLVTIFGLPDVTEADHSTTPFVSLATAIVHQQISTAAATTITNRLWARLDDKLTPIAVHHIDEEALKEIGLSKQKRCYLKDLALHFLTNPALETELHQLPDSEIINVLVPIKGIGVWTVQMYLIFQLWRPDVWPVDDLGIQRGVMKYMELEAMPNKKQILAFAEPGSGIRTLLAWYMWRLASLKKDEIPNPDQKIFNLL
jgi:DNA-3-methyladenine glycosylase II